MKSSIFLIVVSSCFAAETALLSLSLIPENEMGIRAPVDCKDIIWQADCEWFAKAAPVCKVSEKQVFDPEPFRNLAEEYKIPVTKRWTSSIAERREDGTVYFSSGPGKYKWSIANPKTRAFSVGINDYSHFERDADENAIVKPLPGKEQAVAIAREWMKKLGIDEKLLYRHGSGPDGFDVLFRIDLVSRWNKDLQKDKDYDYGITLNFSQQIGGLPVFWTGTGGTLECCIADGGEFCSMQGRLSAWGKIGDYPVLDRSEIEKALREGFAWSGGPVVCDTLTVNNIRLEAYHFREYDPKKDFPLLYTLECQLKGGPDDGDKISIHIPALRMQRDRYGPLPRKPD